VRFLARDWCGGLFTGARLLRRRAGGEDGGEQDGAVIGHGAFPRQEQGAPYILNSGLPSGGIAWPPWNGFSA